MSALGWIVVLTPVAAYALLWLACLRAMKRGHQDTMGGECNERSNPSSPDTDVTALAA